MAETNQRSLLLKALSDQYILRIIAYSAYTPRSIPEMSQNLRIPIASCYRKVKLLEQLGLIEKVGSKLTIEGKRVALYRSKVSRLSMEMHGSKMVIKIKIDDRILQYNMNII